MAKEFALTNNLPMPLEFIERRIYLVRGKKVMFDFDLAELYQVSTKVLNQAVKRNIDRFPEDFMFKLDHKELENWRSQTVTSNRSQIVTGSQKHRDPRFNPYVFTELGVAMLSSVLNSERAIKMNILIMRAFVKLREMLAGHKELAHKINQLEKTQKEQGMVLSLVASEIKGLDKKFTKQFQRLKNPRKKMPLIGFRTD